MDAFVLAAEWFIGLFKAGGDVFVSLVVGIVPLLIVLLTFVNALVALIGPDKIDKVGEWDASCQKNINRLFMIQPYRMYTRH